MDKARIHCQTREYDELEIYLTKPHVVHEYDNLEKSNTFQITQVPE